VAASKNDKGMSIVRKLKLFKNKVSISKSKIGRAGEGFLYDTL